MALRRAVAQGFARGSAPAWVTPTKEVQLLPAVASSAKSFMIDDLAAGYAKLANYFGLLSLLMVVLGTGTHWLSTVNLVT